MDNKKKQIVDLKGIVIFQEEEGKIELVVKLERETLWLTQKQIAVLFDIQRPAITKHLGNIFKSRELKENSVCSILEHTAEDGKVYKTKFYNLDAVLSVGYRVNSIRATQFRIWATKVLKDYLIKGYSINEKRLLEQTKRFKKLQETINFIKNKSSLPELKGQTEELLSIIQQYSNSFTLLYQYDEGKLLTFKTKKEHFILEYNDCLKFINELKRILIDKGEAGNLFGLEIENKFQSVIGNIYQTFENKELYATIEEKAANFLYLIIKDHPFVDGNKRIASFLFIYFLQKNNYLFKKDSTRKISDTALVTLALLIAVSEPKDKNVMINIITNLLMD